MNRIENPPFVNVGAGNKATLSLPLGATYLGILLELTNCTKGQLDRIVVRLGTKILHDITGTRLDKINTYKGGAVSTTHLLIDFTEHQAKDIISEFAGAIGTRSGVSRMMVELDINAAATGVEIKSWSLVAGPTDLSNNIKCLLPQTIYFAGAGEWDIELPHGAASGHLLQRVWLFGSNIDAVEVRKNSGQVDHSTRAANEFLQEHFEGTVDSSFYCVDLVMANHAQAELLTTQDAQDLRLKVTTSGASTITYYLDSLVDLDLL